MMKLKNLLCVVILCAIYSAAERGLRIGEKCQQHGLSGVCQRRSECATVASPIEFRMVSPCADDGVTSVVCCLGFRVTPITGIQTPEFEEDESLESHCAASPQFTTKTTGRKAWDKCIEYQRNLVYPCKRSYALNGGYSRRNNCKHSAGPVIVGGAAATSDEFPHMVQLGYKINEDYVAWSCSGTLLSDWFILTAGHCTSQPIYGQNDKFALYDLSHAAVGSVQNQNENQILNGYQVYSIDREGIFKYPEFKPPNRLHDIALIKTRTRIHLNPSAIPACLPIFGGDITNVTATGWGQTEAKSSSYILQKVTLTRFSDELCLRKTAGLSKRLGLLNTTTQLCYGHLTQRADTCKGDSGGPISIHNPIINCMYSVIGIISYGRWSTCGVIGTPGIYTNVAYYLSWIESLVFPEN